jgi:hypothetical protein
MNRIRLLFSTYYTQKTLFSIGSIQNKTTKTTTHTTHKKHYTLIYLLKQSTMKYETLVKHGIINDSDYQNTKEFMLKNNEQNDLNNNKTE